MKILGIDVGVRNTGFAIIENKKVVSSGVISSPSINRYKYLYENIYSIMKKEAPDVIAYESIFYKTNPKYLIELAQALGIILLAGENLGIKKQEYTTTEIKKSITGNGRASKYRIRMMLEKLLGIKIKNTHIADAIACALCYCFRNNL